MIEKKAFERELKINRAVIITVGIISIFFMAFSEFGDEAFRWSLNFLIVGITTFMFVVITFLLQSISDK